MRQNKLTWVAIRLWGMQVCWRLHLSLARLLKPPSEAKWAEVCGALRRGIAEMLVLVHHDLSSCKLCE